MRTTVNIDDHLLEEAKVLAARQHRSLSDVIDDSLRVTLAQLAETPSRPIINLPTSRGRLLVDLNDKEAVAEALGDNEWPRADR